LRAVDAAGLVTTRSMRVLATPSQLPNLFTSAGEGATFINATRLAEFGGAVYAVAGQSLWRSLDGGLTWQRVPVPSSVTGGIVEIAAGNGALVLQLGSSTFATSRNGMNWETISIPSSSGGTPVSKLSLRFQSGWFAASFIDDAIGGVLLLSKDGITWHRSIANATTNNSGWMTVDDAGAVLSSLTDSLGLGLFRSTVFGDNWNPIPTFAAISSPTVLCQKGLYLAYSGKRTWTSNNGIDWTERFTFSTNTRVISCGDRFFASNEGGGSFTSVSSDRINWQAISGSSTTIGFLVGSAKMGFLSKAYAGTATLWSANGVTWQTVPNSPSDLRTALVRSDSFLAVDGMGAVWQSPNGLTWTKCLPGRSATTMTYASSTQQPSLVSFGSGLLTGGSGGILHLSSADFSTWTRATLDGVEMPANSSIPKITSNGSRALAIIRTSSNTAATGIFRTTNGTAWTKPTQPTTTQTFRAIAENGTSLIAVGTGGLAWRSTDDGLNWTAFTITGLVEGQAVAWFSNKWIVLGTDSATAGSPLKVFYSTNGTTWTKGSSIGLNASSLLMPNLVSGHGKLVCSSTYNPVSTTNGTTWSAMPVIDGRGSSTTEMDMAATSTGWLAVLPATAAVRTGMWTLPADGSAWTPVPPLQEQVTGVENVGSRTFLLGVKFLIEWPEMDFAIEQSAMPTATLGVGDRLSCNVKVRNLGLLTSAESLNVDGWLSKDGFSGDENDIYLGRAPLGVVLPEPGNEISANLLFELPYTIIPGTMHLIVRLDLESRLYETNDSNNVDVSKSQWVVIPARRLSLAANGNGMIVADQLTEYFPDKARVALVAQPGKGSFFTGWDGDVPAAANVVPEGRSTPLNENLVILDSDKTVVANFNAACKLTASTCGGGTVNLDASNGLYQSGTSATLHAEPLSGWTFLGWSGDMSSTAPDASLMMNADKAVTARFTMTLEEWNSRSFTVAERPNPDIAGHDTDPDADGIPNWREWLLGSDPKDAASTGHAPPLLERGIYTFSYTRMEAMPTGHAVRGVASANLRDWSLPLTERVIARTDGIETIEASFDSSGQPKAFFSITTEQPAPEIK
jgi:hypothetical protein